MTIHQNERALTKENFWNELQEHYPLGMKVFCDWIDIYKKVINWDLLFNRANVQPFSIKFHHIPYAFQLGIWYEFLADMGEDREEYPITEFKIGIVKYITILQDRVEIKQANALAGAK